MSFFSFFSNEAYIRAVASWKGPHVLIEKGMVVVRTIVKHIRYDAPRNE